MNDTAKQTATMQTKRKAVRSSVLTKRGLKSFCDPWRPALSTPWSQDQFTFATNGHILVRVARLPDVADWEGDERHPHPPAIMPIFESIAAQRVTRLPAIGFPDCPDCAGSPKRRKACATCNCTGRPPLPLRGALFDPDYIKLVTRLPDVQFSAKPPRNAAARFIFTGGEGALMPLRQEVGRKSQRKTREAAE